MAAETSLKQLGERVALPASPDQAILETIPCAQQPYKGQTIVRFSCPEFTSLCPVTGQPDFAHFVIDYVPSRWLVESKSLKLFMGSFRNHADFHESCTTYIMRRLAGILDPIWISVNGFWFPRGGIPIDVFTEAGTRPAYVPPIDIPVYRAR